MPRQEIEVSQAILRQDKRHKSQSINGEYFIECERKTMLTVARKRRV